jgi:glycosyltransferase involved in cell wall biosynthesis
MKKKLSIIIPCKNEEDIIINSIKSINNRKKYNIIVSDSSTDKTVELLKKFDKNIVIVNGGLPGFARNQGAIKCETPYILFMDADMDISSINLDKLIKDMEDNQIFLSTCKITVNEIFYKFPYFIFSIAQKIISKRTPFAVGGFMLFNNNEFKRLGGFNVDDVFAEDYHLSMKVNPNKFKVYSYRIKTSNRRLKNKSIFYMIRLMILCWINRNNDKFYKNDYNYWN